jgi:hypothetical protein
MAYFNGLECQDSNEVFHYWSCQKLEIVFVYNVLKWNITEN